MTTTLRDQLMRTKYQCSFSHPSNPENIQQTNLENRREPEFFLESDHRISAPPSCGLREDGGPVPRSERAHQASIEHPSDNPNLSSRSSVCGADECKSLDNITPNHLDRPSSVVQLAGCASLKDFHFVSSRLVIRSLR